MSGFGSPEAEQAAMAEFANMLAQPAPQPTFIDKLLQTWPAKLAQSAYSAATLPGEVLRNPNTAMDVLSGARNMSQETFNRATDLASIPMVATTGAPAGALGAGPVRYRAHHGSPNHFDRFDIGRAGSTRDAGHLGRAVYASTDPKVAEKAAHRYEVDVRLNNPLEISLDSWRSDKRDIVRRALDLPPTATAEDVTAAAMKRGHDGVVLDYSPVGYAQREIAVFDDALIDILRKYGLAGLTAGGAVAASSGQSEAGDLVGALIEAGDAYRGHGVQ